MPTFISSLRIAVFLILVFSIVPTEAVHAQISAEMEVEYVDASGVRAVTTVVDGVTTISGIAPFLVKFDASGTRAPDAFAAQSAITDAEAYAFLMVGYRLNYGENLGGNWTYPASSAFPRDEDTGPPIFSYVYNTAGAHNVRLKVRDTLGNEETISFTINVSSAPAATHIPVSAGSWPTFVSGSRYTLEANGDYRSFGNLETGGLHNIVIEKTGAGADPRISTFSPDGRSKFAATQLSEFRAAHIRLINIDMENFFAAQRGFDYVGVIGGLVRQFTEGGQAFLWQEGTDITRSNVRFPRGLFLQGTEVRSAVGSSGFVMFGTFNGLHARDTRFVHAVNGPTTYLMLRIYGSNFTFRNNLWFSEVNGGGANGLPVGLLAINGLSPTAWRDDDTVGPNNATNNNENYGYISEKQIVQNNQFYAAGSFITNAVASVGGGNPSGSSLVYPRLIGMEDNVYFPAGDVALLIQNGQLYGQYAFWRNNRKNLGLGDYVPTITGAPNQSVGDTTTYNGPFFSEDINTRPVPTSFSGTPAPVVTFSVSSSTITTGSSTTLTWSSTNATSCTASNGWSGARATSGSLVVSPTATTTYTLTCTGAGGSDVESRTVTVTTATPAPITTFSASPTSITSGNSATLTWSTTNATTCTASNGWSGARATSGSLVVTPTLTTTYTLTCTGAGGSDVESRTVTVTPATVTPPSSGGGGGGGGGGGSRSSGTKFKTNQAVILLGAQIVKDLGRRTDLDTQASSSQGTIVSGTTKRSGGITYYQVSFTNGLTGWVPATTLAVYKAPTTTTTPTAPRSTTPIATPVLTATTTNIQTTSRVNLRLSPGGIVLTQLELGTQGVIEPDIPSEVKDGYTWVYVYFGNISGYVAREFLRPQGATNNTALQQQIQLLLAEVQRLMQLLAERQGR